MENQKNKKIDIKLIKKNNDYQLTWKIDNKDYEINIVNKKIEGLDIYNNIYLPNYANAIDLKVNVTTDLNNDKVAQQLVDQINSLFDEIKKSIKQNLSID